MLTYGFLKKICKGITPIQSCNNDNTLITYGDILNEKYCPCFKNHSNPSQIKNGIKLLSDNIDMDSVAQESMIEMLYCKLNNLSFNCPTLVSPCGETIDVSPIGVFGLYKRTSSFIDTLVNKIEHSVNAVVKKTSNDSSVLDNKTLTIPPNFGDNDITITLQGTYLYKGTKKSAVACILQKVNSVTEKKLDRTEWDDFSIKASDYLVGNNGGQIMLSSHINRRDFYYSYDSCGNRIDSTIEVIEQEQDVTNSTIFKTNSQSFQIVGNIVVIDKQDVNSNQRQCSIVGLYNDKMSNSIKITQEEGEKEQISYSLLFDDGTVRKTLYLNDSTTASTFFVKIHSVKSSSINGNVMISIPNGDIGIRVNDNWVTCEVHQQEGEYFILKIQPIESNSSHTQYRETDIDIYGLYDDNKELTCHIVQMPNKPIKTSYNIILSGDVEFHYEEGKTREITIKGLKTVYYDDGYNESKPLSRYEDIIIDCIPSDEEFLPKPTITTIDFDKTKLIKCTPFKKSFQKDVVLQCAAYIKDISQEMVYSDSKILFDIIMIHDEPQYVEHDIKVNVATKDISNDLIIKNATLTYHTKDNTISQVLFNGLMWICKESQYDTIYWGSLQLLESLDYFITLGYGEHEQTLPLDGTELISFHI